MANINAPSGLSPVRFLSGASWNAQANQYFIASTDTNAFAIGDPVTLSGTGDGAGVPGITLATAGAGNPILGVIVGMGGKVFGGPGTDINNTTTVVIPATKTVGYYVMVADDPNILFEIQESTTGAALSQTAIGQNVNLLAGANNGFVSGWQFNNTSGGVGATLQLQLLSLAYRSDNAFGANAKWLARINNHQFRAGVAGV